MKESGELKDLGEHIGEVYYELMKKYAPVNVTKDFVNKIVEELAEKIRSEDNSVKITFSKMFFNNNDLMIKVCVEILDWYEGYPSTVVDFYLDLPILPLENRSNYGLDANR